MKTITTAVLCTSLVMTCTCHALDSAPGDYAWAGDNTAIMVLYGQYQQARHFATEGQPSLPDSKLQTTLGIVRGVYYKEIDNKRLSFQFFVPAGGFATARINGMDQPVAEGMGDLTLGSTFYPLASSEPTGTTLGLSTFITLPSGNHDPDKVSLGSGRWILTPQAGLVQGLGNGFWFNGIVDMAFQQNRRYHGVKDSSDPSTQIQAYLGYQLTPASTVNLGYSGRFGGERYLDREYTGSKTRSDQLRFFASTFVTPDLHLQAMLGRDIRAEGGFKDDIVVQLRLAKLF